MRQARFTPAPAGLIWRQPRLLSRASAGLLLHNDRMLADPELDQGAVRIRPVAASDLPEVVRLCAAGMCDNPLHVRVFGTDRAQRLQRLGRFFAVTIAYVQRHGLLYGAYRDGHLLGVFGLLGPGRCRPAPGDWLRLMAVFRSSPTPAGALALARWLLTWWWHDPPEPHWHLGPLVVAPELQGSGIGIRLIASAAAQLPGPQPMAWLETDKPANVRLYEKLGFRVVRTAPVLGVRNWFMQGALRVDLAARLQARSTAGDKT